MAPSSRARSRSPGPDGSPTSSSMPPKDTTGSLLQILIEGQSRIENLLNRLVTQSSSNVTARQPSPSSPALEPPPTATADARQNAHRQGSELAPPAISLKVPQPTQPQRSLPDMIAKPRFSDLPLFSGTHSRIVSWLDEISKWPRRLGLEDLDDLIYEPHFPIINFLEGPALSWYERKRYLAPFLSFADFQNRILEYSIGPEWRQTLERAAEKPIGRHEAPEEYCANLQRLIFLVHVDLPRSEREKKLSRAFALGLVDPVERMQCLGRIDDRSDTPVEQLVSLVRRFRTGGGKAEQLTVAALPISKGPAPVSKGPDNPRTATGRCFRCNQSGHLVRDCPYVVVPRKTLLDNGLTLTFNLEEEKKLPDGARFVRVLSCEETEDSEKDTSLDIEPEFYVRALSTIQRPMQYWIKREIRVEIRLPWLDRPLNALFDCGADVTVLNAAYSEGANMLDIPLPNVKDASDVSVSLVGVSREKLNMGHHTFPTIVVWAHIPLDAILGMDVIGPWMLSPRWTTATILSERDSTIAIPFSNSRDVALGLYRLQIPNSEEEPDEYRMDIPAIDLTPKTVDLDAMISPDLSSEHRNTLLAVLEEFAILFDEEPTRCNLFQHSITLTTNKPVHSPPRRVNPIKLEIIQKHVDTMLEKGLIAPSHSPYASPVLLVDRKGPGNQGREPRFCVDYRKLNEVTIKDQYSLPAADDLLLSLRGCSHFAVFDLKSGFWQIELDPATRPLTAFTFPGGLYEFNVMPFGLCNAPATFQRLMDVVLGPMKHTIALVFMDDILVKGESIQKLAENCRKIFTKLKQANLRFNPSKARVGFQKLIYLGHVISSKGISPDPAKVQCIKDYPRPTNRTEVQTFLGMINYYRKFIPQLTDHSRPLERLGASKSWNWSKEAEKSFQECKEILSEKALLYSPDYSLPFVIQTDASSVGLGAVLLQFVNGEERPIWFASRALSECEAKYHARELECLAVKWALRRFRPIIEGCSVTVITDHESLVWLMRQDVPLGRLARWVLELQGTEFTILHRKGTLNRNADALSRAIPVQRLYVLAISAESSPWKERLLIAQRDEYGAPFGKGDGWDDNYIEYDGLICRKLMIKGQEWFPVLVPQSLRAEVLQAYHEDKQAGHFGIHLTYELVRRRYYWENMKSDVAEAVKACLNCLLAKQARGRQPGTMGTLCPTHLNQVICIDHVGPLGGSRRSWVLVIMDAMTRWAEVVAVNSISAKTTAKAIQDAWFCRYGAPEAILTDNGTAFHGSPMRKLLAEWQVVHHRISPYHPQANPVERLHADLKRLLRSALLENRNWKEELQMSAFCLRNRICHSLGASPSELIFGAPLRMPLDLNLSTQDQDARWNAATRRDQAVRAARKLRYDRTHRDLRLKTGDLVGVKRQIPAGALASPFVGPYEVRERLRPSSYKLKHIHTGQVIRRHVTEVRPWRTSVGEGDDVLARRSPPA